MFERDVGTELLSHFPADSELGCSGVPWSGWMHGTVFCAIQHSAPFSCMTSSESPSLFVHSLYNREKSSSVPSQAIVMMNMSLITMNSQTGTVGAI